MQECIDFQMQIKKKIPEVLEFVTKKMVEEKMAFYCGEDAQMIEQFGWWCKDYLTIDKKKGIVHGYSDVQMYYDYVFTFQKFVEDLANCCPNAEFSGSIDKTNDEVGTEFTINFTFKKGQLDFEEVVPDFDEYGEYDEYDEYDDEDCEDDEDFEEEE